MEMLKILNELNGYYISTRQAGHTTLMKRGTSNYEQKKLVLFVNKSHVHPDIRRDEVVTLGSIDRLRGHNLPLAIDNGTLSYMFQKTYDEVKQYEEEKEVYVRIARDYQSDIEKMRREPFKTLFKTLWQRW